MQINKYKARSFISYVMLYVLLILTIILPMVSFRISEEFSAVFPSLEINIIFFLAIYKSNKFPILIITIYTIMLDLIYGLPIGISTIPAIIVSFLLHQQRQIFLGKDFKIIFLAFITTNLIYLMIKMALFCWYFSYFIKLELVIMQYITSLAVYPLMHRLLQKVT